MDNLTLEVLRSLAVEDQTVAMVTDYLNTLVNLGAIDPLLASNRSLEKLDVKQALDEMLREGWVTVTRYENDLSQPQLHGKWFSLTEEGGRVLQSVVNDIRISNAVGA